MPSKFQLLTTLVLLSPATMIAQSVSTAQLAGVVKDSTGAGVPSADVKATQTATGVTRTIKTNSNGEFTLNPLPPGPYRIEITSAGFSTYVQEGLVLEVGSSPSITPVLQVGAVEERVTVQAATTLIETQQVGVGQVIDQKRIEELPLNGRQVTQLITLAGATTPAPAADLNTSKNYPTVTISVAGGQATGITFILDGANHNDPFNNLNLPLPMPDSLQEFKAETSALPAQYGYHATAAVNVVTRSGTNQFHGVLFDFFRNGVLNARDAFATVRDTLKRNQFGGTIGGPILRDKLFFFGGYQGTITRTATPATTLLPTATLLAKGFTAKGVTYTPAQYNAQSLALLKYVPVPNDNTGALTANYTYVIPNNSTEHQGTGRLDYSLSDKQQMFVRQFTTFYVNPPAFDGLNALTTTKAGANDKVYSTTFGDTYIFSQRLVNQFRAALNRTNAQRTVAAFFSPADLGVQISTQVPKYTNLSVTGSLAVGGAATNPGHFNTTVPSVSDDVLFTAGRHQIGFGALYIKAITNTLNTQYPNGQFTFSNTFTGTGIYDFLLGDLGTFSQGNPQIVRGRLNYIGLYVDDVYKVTPRLTLSYGLRWDPLFPTYTPNQHDMHFSQADFNNNVKSTQYVNAPVGVSFPGDPNFTAGRNSNGPTKKTNFAPRFGLAWDPRGDGRTSFRASYGIFYDLPTLFNESRFASAPPWGASFSLNPVAGGFTNPYASSSVANPFPALYNNTGSNAFFPIGGALLTFPAKTQAPYIHQYNLSFQQQVGRDYVLKVEYIGNTTIHQAAYQELNPSVYIPGVFTGPGSCGGLVAGQGLPTTVGAACSSTTNANQRRQLSLKNYSQGQYISTLANQDTGGTASYNGLLVTAQHRFANNFSILANYTWSKCMSDPVTHELSGDGSAYSDPTNRRFDRGQCSSDIRNVANISGVLLSPGVGNNHLVHYVTGGWQFSPIATMRSASFFTVTTGADTSLNGINNIRALTTGSPYLASPVRSTTTNGRVTFLNYANFVAPAAGTLGNPPRAFSIAGPKYLEFDAAVSRIFPVNDGKQQVELRGEGFNVLNRVNYNTPTATLSSGASLFGVTTSDSNATPRIIQLALKIRY